jgi:hypothetical protein
MRRLDLIANAWDYRVARSSRAMTAGSVARHGFTFQTAKIVMASPCEAISQPRHCERSEAIHAASKERFASSLTLLAMTYHAAREKTVIPRACGGSSNTRRRDSISGAGDYGVARSSRAMTAGSVARHGFTCQTTAVMASPCEATSQPRHCERSEAIRAATKEWIASSLTLLAMTAAHMAMTSRHKFAASRGH